MLEKQEREKARQVKVREQELQIERQRLQDKLKQAAQNLQWQHEFDITAV